MNTKNQEKQSLAEKKARFEKFKSAFEKRFINPNIAGTVDEFRNKLEKYGGLWVSADKGNNIREDTPAFLYYSVHPDYDCSVHVEARRWFEENSAWVEFHDAGTVMVYLSD